jgi:transposase
VTAPLRCRPDAGAIHIFDAELLRGCTHARPYPKELHDDVMRGARNRGPGQQLKQIVADFGISESCLAGWLKTADVEDGIKRGTTATENTELVQARKRIKLLEQENEVLRRAAHRDDPEFGYRFLPDRRRRRRPADGRANRAADLLDHQMVKQFR